MDDQNRKLAGLILNCKPKEIKAISTRADGSLAVVAPNGMKFIFSPVELENARDSFGLPATGNPLAEPVEAGGACPAASIPAQQKTLRGTVASSTTGNPPAEPVEASGACPAASIPAQQNTLRSTVASSTTGNPLAEPVEASGSCPPISISAQQKTLRGTVASSATGDPLAEPVEAGGTRTTDVLIKVTREIPATGKACP